MSTLFNGQHCIAFYSTSANDMESYVAGIEPSVNSTAIDILKLQNNISTLQQLLADLDSDVQNVSVPVQI